MTTETKSVSYHALTQVLQGETSAESEILLPDYYPSIMKLIHTDASVMVRSQSVRGDKAYVDGAVEFRILYLSEADDGFHSVFYQIPFSYATDIHGAEPDTAQIRVTPRLTYVNTRALSPQKLYAKAAVSLSVFVFEPSAIDRSDEAETSGLITLSETQTLSDVLLSPSKIIRISEEIDPGTGIHPAQILRYEVSFAEPEKKNIHTKTIVKSELKIKVYYTVEKDTTVRTALAHVPFSQVVETPENATEDNTFVRFHLCDCHLSVKEKSQSASVIDMDAEVSVSADCFVNESMPVILDAYSLTNDVTFSSREISYQTAVPLHVPFEFRDSLPVEEGERVVDVCTDTELVSSVYNGETKNIELMCRTVCRIICENLDGEYTETSRDLPFTCLMPVKEGCDEVICDAVFRFSSFDILPTEKAVEIRSIGTCTGIAVTRKRRNLLYDLTVSDKRKEKMPGFIAYMTRDGESVWEIGKRYAADPEEIKRNNAIDGDKTDGKKMIFIRR